MDRASRFLLAILALLATPATAADVWVVGPGGLATIQEGVDLASDGDIVLVKPGTRAAFTVDSKSLVIVADPAGSVSVDGTVVVSNLAVDQSVTLEGLAIQGTLGAAVRAVSNEGSLWIEDCELRGAHESTAGPYPGFEAIACGSILLRRSTSTGGGGGFYDGAPGAPGVVIDDSTASVYACTLVGGFGGCGGPPRGCTTQDGEVGGAGAALQGGFLLLVASTATGGKGGCGDYCEAGSPCGDGGDGGPGLHVDGGSSEVVDTVLQGGGGGGHGSGPFCDPCPCIDGDEGPPLVVVQGTVTQLAETSRLLIVDSPLREGQTWTATVFGEPNELVHAFASLGTAQLEPPALYGFRLLAPPSALLGSVTLPAGGSAQFQGTVPELGPSIQGLPFHMQVVGLPPSGGVALGEAATIVLLDSAF